MSHTLAYIQLISFDFGAPNTAFDVSKGPIFDQLSPEGWRQGCEKGKKNGCGHLGGDEEIAPMGPPGSIRSKPVSIKM